MLSIIIPTYNERANVTLLIHRLHKVLNNRPYEVIFVDDNSSDTTVETIRLLQLCYPVSVIERHYVKGLATAVLEGIRHAKGDLICVMDADLQHPPEMLPQLIDAIVVYGADLAVASRYVSDGGCVGWSWSRRITSRVATAIAHICLPSSRRIKDPMSGFFVFRRSNISKAVLQPIGFKILLEIFIMGHFHRDDVGIAEIPFIFVERQAGSSKMRVRQQIEFLKHVFSLMRRSRRADR